MNIALSNCIIKDFNKYILIEDQLRSNIFFLYGIIRFDNSIKVYTVDKISSIEN